METDFEDKTPEDARERNLMLIAVLMLVSVAVHTWFMLSVSDLSVAPLLGNTGAEAFSAKELKQQRPQKMNVQTYKGDPVKDIVRDMPRPAPAPDKEKAVERVERLSGDLESAIAPEMPESPESARPAATDGPAPRAVDAATWQPRQEIMSVPEPEVPDVREALPRVVIPKVQRVGDAADIVPAFDLMESVDSIAASAVAAGRDKARPSLGGPRSVAASDGTKPIPPVAPRALPEGSSFAATGGGVPLVAPTVLSAAEEEQKRRAEAEAAEAKGKGKTVAQLRAEKLAEASAKAAKPPPPPPAMARVDEAVVAQEKAAVRKLRDERSAAGRPFDGNVNVNLGFWRDPAHPKVKYFRVRVASNREAPLPIISKDIVFMLDASGSIGNDRLKSCRNAVLEALDRLNTGDRFNVVAFRDKFSYAFPETAWREVDANSVEQARKWLSTLKAHGNTDVFRTLRSVLTMPRDPARPIVAFVATDGDATSGMTRSAEIISRFSELNGGLVSIYMYGVKPEANAYLMDMLTRCNRGSWAFHKGFRWLAAAGVPALSRQFEKPVLSDVAVVFSASSRSETYPKLVPNLCEDEPIEIYGICPADQQEIVFQMRGLNAVTSCESMFTIPFARADELGPEVRTAWATRRIYEMVAEYTRRPDKKLLGEIHSFAAAYGVSVPYEKEIK